MLNIKSTVNFMFLNQLDKLLFEKPLEFMKRYAVSPPDAAGMQTVPDPTRLNFEGMPMNKTVPVQPVSSSPLWDDTTGLVTQGPKNFTAIRVTGCGVVHINVVNVDRDKPGAKTFDVSPIASQSRVPIHFLPWNSGSLVDMKLQDVGADLDNPDNPRIFFTAALSGCSVFVDGHPARPRIVHAGITGKLAVDAKGFWEERLLELAKLRGQPIDDHLRSIDKSRYVDTIWGIAYKNWLESTYKDSLTIQEVKEWASVFGIRYGRLWSFYLQKNATVSTIRLVKKSEVSTQRDSSGVRKHIHTASNLHVEKHAKGTGLIDRHRSVYLLKQSYARPIMIEEFYPNASGQGEAKISVEDKYCALF
ncbi:hypothetical protein ACH50O_16385 [Methylomonas sp. 2BW1-5-20]|uniref:hypothetical protein n=1 Tax=Methylomonas sp. 2BW1-5-20 TaxID=3376686 RepID=UPI00404D96E5